MYCTMCRYTITFHCSILVVYLEMFYGFLRIWITWSVDSAVNGTSLERVSDVLIPLRRSIASSQLVKTCLAYIMCVLMLLLCLQAAEASVIDKRPDLQPAAKCRSKTSVCTHMYLLLLPPLLPLLLLLSEAWSLRSCWFFFSVVATSATIAYTCTCMI